MIQHEHPGRTPATPAPRTRWRVAGTVLRWRAPNPRQWATCRSRRGGGAHARTGHATVSVMLQPTALLTAVIATAGR